MSDFSLLNERLPEVSPGIRVSWNRSLMSSTKGKWIWVILLLNVVSLYVLLIELQMPHDPTVATGFIIVVLGIWIWRTSTITDKPTLLWHSVSWIIPALAILALALSKRWDLVWLYPTTVAMGIALPVLSGAYCYAFVDHLEIDKHKMEIRQYRSRLFKSLLCSIPLNKASYTLAFSLASRKFVSDLTIYVHVSQEGQKHEIGLCILYKGTVIRKDWLKVQPEWEQEYGKVKEQLISELQAWARI